jgi:hypothetical protein
MRSARLPSWLTPLFVAGIAQAQPAPPAEKSPPPATAAPAPAPAPAPTTPTAAPPAASPADAAPADAPAPEPKPKAAAKPADEDGKSKFVVVDDSEPEPAIIPLATDTLAGHFTLGAGVGLAVPFGKLESGASESDAFDPSLLFSVDAAFGVSRNVALGAYGQYLSYSADDDCVDCEPSGFAVGAFVRYHLVQGTRFDPWALAGLGYRKTTIKTPGGDLDYSGIDWLHLQVGGDWYPISVLGVGPYLGLDFGYYGDHPDDSRDSAAHWQFSTGLRLLLDVPGK